MMEFGKWLHPLPHRATPSSLKGDTITEKGCSPSEKQVIFFCFEEDKQRNLIITFQEIYQIRNQIRMKYKELTFQNTLSLIIINHTAFTKQEILASFRTTPTLIRKDETQDITIYILSFCLSSASVVNDLELFYVFMGSWYGANTKLALSKWVFMTSSDFFL